MAAQTDSLRKFDFSRAKGHLVASVPGHHFGGKLHSYGVNRLAALLAKYGGAESQRRDDEIDIQFSSFSRPAPKLLAALEAAFHAPAPLCRPPPRVRPSIVWMTSTEARDSVEGYGAGSCMPSNLKNVREAPRESPGWTKTGPPPFRGGPAKAPHIKTYTRYSADGSTVR